MMDPDLLIAAAVCAASVVSGLLARAGQNEKIAELRGEVNGLRHVIVQVINRGGAPL